MELHIDLETRSREDLRKHGVYRYASDPSTEIVCASWAFDDGDILVQDMRGQETLPAAVQAHIDAGGILVAHNAAFERLMFRHVLGIDVPIEQWRCTAFMARASNIPGSLHDAARSMGIRQQKDRSGRNLIGMLSVPQADGTFNNDEDLHEAFRVYCKQDVATERNLHQRLREPDPLEWEDYWVSERINDRGIPVDINLARLGTEFSSIEQADLVGKIATATRGEVTKVRGEGLKEWVLDHITEEQKAVMRTKKGKYSLNVDARRRLLDFDDLDLVVAEVIEYCTFAQKTAGGKFQAMLDRSLDGRVYGAFVPNGASQTGRFASWGLQCHNFPRDCMDDPDQVIHDMEHLLPAALSAKYGMPVMDILSQMLRAAIQGALQVSDWSAIEGRVGPWLCDNRWGEEKLDVYRAGLDPYVQAAQAIYPGQEIDKARRQVGKVAELALGFGGGVGAFQAMASGYGVHMTDSEAEAIKVAWRVANPWATRMWRTVENAAMDAVRNPGVLYPAGRLRYIAAEGVLAGGTTLWCILPDGRPLTYPQARIELMMTPWGEERPGLTAMRSSRKPKSGEKQWPRVKLWSGLLQENAVQGTAASLLRHALREAHKRGLPVAMHVHDEIIAENGSEAVLAEIMNTAPDWAEGLPLVADVDNMRRFGK